MTRARFPQQAPGRMAAVGFMLLVAVTSCGRNAKETIPIRGTVSYRGKPLTTGTVLYVPQDRVNGRQARGPINADGTFELTTFKPGDGAMQGQYDIAVVALKQHPGEDRAAIEAAGGIIQRGSLIPEHYGNPAESGLSDLVDGEHPGTKRIELND